MTKASFRIIKLFAAAFLFVGCTKSDLAINSVSTHFFQRISADGKYLFFNSNRQEGGTTLLKSYWADSKILEDL